MEEGAIGRITEHFVRVRYPRIGNATRHNIPGTTAWHSFTRLLWASVSLINPEEFQCSFLDWVKTIQTLTKGEVIVIDGKQLRGSKDKRNGQAAIDMVSAWATANELGVTKIS